MNSRPIGIFDSGIGGLTVAKAVIDLMPSEDIIYLGDTARVPYGTRDPVTIREFALQLVEFLLKKDVKYLVVACNTISATCLDEIIKHSPVPVIGVIDPTVQRAVETTKTRSIGVIGTRATINSQIYTSKITTLNKDIEVLSQACPLFVPLVEEGSLYNPATLFISEQYLTPFINEVDTLILGCTHYPLLRKAISETVGESITLVDSAQPTAQFLLADLKEKDLLSKKDQGTYSFYITDAPERVYQVVNDFFEGKLPGTLEKVELI